ncbi:MAG: gamma-butyrobetaine hydroxylase-like domain-containing protein, partial [Pirellula sp.]
MSSEVIPVAIERTKNEEIQIRWSDSSVSVWTASELRKACPCATCKEKKKGQDHQQS